MSTAGLTALPTDVLSLIAEECLKQDDGSRQLYKLTRGLPRLLSLPLPRATPSQITRLDMPWEGDCARIIYAACMSFCMNAIGKPAEAVQAEITGKLCLALLRRDQVGIGDAATSIPSTHSVQIHAPKLGC